MKKQAKTTLCLVISMLMLLPTLAFGVAAEDHTEVTGTSINNNLVAHWDFEGDTPEEQLADKAPAVSGNKRNDALSAYKSSDDALVIENGVATVKPDAGTYLWLSNSDFSSFDGRVIENSTIYTKFRFTGSNTGFAYLMQINGIFRLFRHGNGDIRVQYYADSIGAAQTASGLGKVEPGQDVYFAFATKEIDQTNGKLTCILYLSTDGKNYNHVSVELPVSTYRVGNGRTVAGNAGNGLYIGNHNGKTDTGLDFEFDDIRFYNASFSKAQVSQIARLDDSAPVVAGCQNMVTVSANGTQSVRFISTLATDAYTEAGYRIDMSYEKGGETVTKTLEQKCMTVFESLTATTDGELATVTAGSLGGKYLMPLTLDGIPCDRTITFTVTAYGVDENGTHNSIPVVFVFTNGAFTSATRA